MKKTLIAYTFFSLGLLACNSAQAVGMPILAKKHGCYVCHDINTRIVGPGWMEVSKKYKGVAKYTYGGKEYSLENGLVMKVSKGGSGNWGVMPMPAMASDVKDKDIRALVKFILALAK
jgi:cytochrome c551/c552